MAAYLAGPETLAAAVSQLTEMQLRMSLRRDSWTIRQIIHHIVDGDDVWKGFIKQAIGNPGSEFSLAWYWAIPQDTWAARWRYAEREIEPSLSLFRANRLHIAQLLHANPAAWDHELNICRPQGKSETMTIAQVVEMQTWHAAHHLSAIQDILRTHPQ